MNQQELEQWIAQNGGAGGLQYITKTINVKNPAKSATLDDGSDNPDYDPTAPATISAQVQSWTNPATGASIAVRATGPGQYEDLGQTGAKPASSDPGAAAADANAVELQRQRERNKALPPEQDPAYETDAERRARGRQTAIDQQTAADKEEARAKAANAGGTIVDRGPEGVFIVKPNGDTIKTNLPGKPQPSSTTQTKLDDGSVVVIRVDADGNVTTTEAVKAPTSTPIPASATGWSPDPSKPDVGIGERRKAVAGMLESGVFGPPESREAQEKANALLKQDYDHATLVSQNLGNAATTEGTIFSGNIRQREADQSQANTRLTQATSTFTSTMKDIMANAGKAKSGATVAAALAEIWNNYRLFTEQFGGLKNEDRIEPGENMTRTGPNFQPLGGAPAAAAPVAPRDDNQAAANPVGFGEPTPAPAAPPDTQFTPPPTGAPGGPGWPSITDRAQQARQLFGATEPDPLAPSPPPIAGADPAAASQAQAMIGQRAPVSGGTLSWARQLNFSPEAIEAFMAIENGPQVAA